MKRTWMLAAAVAIGTVMGCVGPNGIMSTSSGGSGTGAGGNGTGNSGNTGTAGEGLPCDIATILATHCMGCHNSPTAGGAPNSLVSYPDLIAHAPSGETYAQRSLIRMQAGTMPPGGGVSAAEIAAFKAWVDQGAPQGSCGDVDAGPPDPTFQGDPTCESGQTSPHINDPENSPTDPELMNPGEKCVSCHGGEPAFNVAGTVFATGKVTDRCKPPATIDLTQAKVIITDKNGVDHTLSVNSVGNFHTPDWPQIQVPYTAKVTYQGKTRAMASSQTNGDCNACHTAAGTQGAPGRVAIPQ